MPFVLICTFILLSSKIFDLFKFQSEILDQPHLLCLKLAPISEYTELYRAIVCGEKLTNPHFFRAFRDSGLIHIIVVSGSHLLTLQSLIRWPRIQIPFLLFYSCVTNFQPPVVRGIIQIFLYQVNKRLSLNWSNNLMTFSSGLISWALFPSWIESLSFQLSWICATTLCFTENRSLFVRATMLYFATGIVLSQFHWPHPISIVINTTLVPIFWGIIFPASLISFFISPLSYLTDFLWAGTLSVCQYLTSGILMFPSCEIESLRVWIVLWFVSLFVQIKSLLPRSRSSWFSLCAAARKSPMCLPSGSFGISAREVGLPESKIELATTSTLVVKAGFRFRSFVYAEISKMWSQFLTATGTTHHSSGDYIPKYPISVGTVPLIGSPVLKYQKFLTAKK